MIVSPRIPFRKGFPKTQARLKEWALIYLSLEPARWALLL